MESREEILKERAVIQKEINEYCKDKGKNPDTNPWFIIGMLMKVLATERVNNR